MAFAWKSSPHRRAAHSVATGSASGSLKRGGKATKARALAAARVFRPPQAHRNRRESDSGSLQTRHFLVKWSSIERAKQITLAIAAICSLLGA